MIEEVYGSNWTNKKYKKKKKKENKKIYTPEEMETEFISDSDRQEFNKRNTLQSRVSQIGASPYDNTMHYEDTRDRYPSVQMPENVYWGPLDPFRRDQRKHQEKLYGDPEYQEFLEYKRMKQKQNNSSDNEQFNELLLYIFTGIFLLILYDNIFKMGQRF